MSTSQCGRINRSIARLPGSAPLIACRYAQYFHIPGDGCMSRVGTSDCLPKFVLKDREFWQELASFK